jgi:hypothetical protein
LEAHLFDDSSYELKTLAELSEEEIVKIANQTSTHPLYINEDGTIFSASDLVKGYGYLVRGGKKFKPTKYKPFSLADHVISSSFGKVKGKND